MKLTLNGKTLDLYPPTPTQDRLVKFLESLPDGVLLNKLEVMAQSGIGRCSLGDSAHKFPKLAPYRLLISSRMGYVFGNVRSIAEVAKKLQQGSL